MVLLINDQLPIFHHFNLISSFYHTEIRLRQSDQRKRFLVQFTRHHRSQCKEKIRRRRDDRRRCGPFTDRFQQTAVVVEEPRVNGTTSTLPLAFSPESGCLRSVISPLFQSYPPQNESGSRLTNAIPLALPDITGFPINISLSIKSHPERSRLSQRR